MQRISVKVIAHWARKITFGDQTACKAGALAVDRCQGCFKLHFDVVFPPYMHNLRLELFGLRESRTWKFHSGGLLRVDMLHV